MTATTSTDPLPIEEVIRIARAPLPYFHLAAPHSWGGRSMGTVPIPPTGRRVWPTGTNLAWEYESRGDAD